MKAPSASQATECIALIWLYVSVSLLSEVVIVCRWCLSLSVFHARCLCKHRIANARDLRHITIIYAALCTHGVKLKWYSSSTYSFDLCDVILEFLRHDSSAFALHSGLLSACLVTLIHRTWGEPTAVRCFACCSCGGGVWTGGDGSVTTETTSSTTGTGCFC